jgi:hypothetical protein
MAVSQGLDVGCSDSERQSRNSELVPRGETSLPFAAGHFVGVSEEDLLEVALSRQSLSERLSLTKALMALNAHSA